MGFRGKAARHGHCYHYSWLVASLDRKRLGADCRGQSGISIRGVFDKETRRKPLAFAAEAVCYGI